MTAPKEDTIRRYCSNALAIELLHERGLLDDEQAADLHHRDRLDTAAAYARIYSPRDAYNKRAELDDAIEAARAAGWTPPFARRVERLTRELKETA